MDMRNICYYIILGDVLNIKAVNITTIDNITYPMINKNCAMVLAGN